MKAFLAIVVLCLFSSTLAYYNVKRVPSTIIDTAFLKTSNTPKKHTFAGLTTLMQQLRDVSSVQDFLNGLLEQLAETRQQKLAIIEQTRANCAEEATFRDQAVTEGQSAAVAAQNQLNLCGSQRDQSVHLRDLAASALEIYQNDVVELDSARDDQVRNYETNVAKLTNIRDVISQLQALVDEFEAEANSPLQGSQFIQLTNKLLRHSVSSGHSHLVLPVYTTLLQLHARQSVSADDLAQIRSLLNALDENAANTIQALNDQEAVDQQNYNDESARLQGLINRLTNQVSVTEQFTATMDQCLAQETSILELSNDKVTRNGDLLTVSQQLCSASEEEWRLSELNRSKEVNIINALKAAINRLETDYEEQEGPQVGDIIQLRML